MPNVKITGTTEFKNYHFTVRGRNQLGTSDLSATTGPHQFNFTEIKTEGDTDVVSMFTVTEELKAASPDVFDQVGDNWVCHTFSTGMTHKIEVLSNVRPVRVFALGGGGNGTGGCCHVDCQGSGGAGGIVQVDAMDLDMGPHDVIVGNKAQASSAFGLIGLAGGGGGGCGGNGGAGGSGGGAGCCGKGQDGGCGGDRSGGAATQPGSASGGYGSGGAGGGVAGPTAYNCGGGAPGGSSNMQTTIAGEIETNKYGRGGANNSAGNRDQPGSRGLVMIAYQTVSVPDLPDMNKVNVPIGAAKMSLFDVSQALYDQEPGAGWNVGEKWVSYAFGPGTYDLDVERADRPFRALWIGGGGDRGSNTGANPTNGGGGGGSGGVIVDDDLTLALGAAEITVGAKSQDTVGFGRTALAGGRGGNGCSAGAQGGSGGGGGGNAKPSDGGCASPGGGGTGLQPTIGGFGGNGAAGPTAGPTAYDGGGGNGGGANVNSYIKGYSESFGQGGIGSDGRGNPPDPVNGCGNREFQRAGGKGELILSWRVT